MSDAPQAGGRTPGRTRRAVRPATGGPPDAGAGASGRSADDTDAGWKRPAPSASSSTSAPSADDERWLRDRPPHWG